jgi:hypothetical protein
MIRRRYVVIQQLLHQTAGTDHINRLSVEKRQTPSQRLPLQQQMMVPMPALLKISNDLDLDIEVSVTLVRLKVKSMMKMSTKTHQLCTC